MQVLYWFTYILIARFQFVNSKLILVQYFFLHAACIFNLYMFVVQTVGLGLSNICVRIWDRGYWFHFNGLVLKTLLHYIPFVWIGMVYSLTLFLHIFHEMLLKSLSLRWLLNSIFTTSNLFFSLHSKIINGTENFSKPWIAWFLTKVNIQK